MSTLIHLVGTHYPGEEQYCVICFANLATANGTFWPEGSSILYDVEGQRLHCITEDDTRWVAAAFPNARQCTVGDNKQSEYNVELG